MSEDEVHLVTMPKWGLAMQEGTIIGWHVAEGERVAQGQPLCDIETAKITNEYGAPFSGLVNRIVRPAETVVAVGEVIAVIADAMLPRADVDGLVAAAQATRTAKGDDGPAGPDLRIVHTNEGAIAFVETGSADADRLVLFLHGFGGDHNNWGLLQADLPEHVRSIAIDLPGHGRSVKDVKSGSARDIARIVSAFLDIIGAAKVDLVAHSFGANVAAEVAAVAPERIASLFVIAPPAFGAVADPGFVRGYLGAQRKRDLKPVMEMLFSDPGFVSRAIVNDALAVLRDDDARAALTLIGNGLLGARPGDAKVELAFLQRWPSVIVWGDADRIVPLPGTLAALAEGALQIVSGAGHMPHAENVPAVAQLLRAHLEGAVRAVA